MYVSSCGLENYIYLEPVESAGVNGNTATIILPNNSGNAYFRNYVIFYRIYISDNLSTSVSTSDERSQINSALASHYNTLDPYTTNDNVSPNAVGSVFTNLKYHTLEIEDNDSAIEQLLGTSGYGSVPPAGAGVSITLDFTVNPPVIKLSNDPDPDPDHGFVLYRASGFTHAPDRFFVNSTGPGSITDDSAAYNSTTVNADVERKTNINAAASSRYTYVSLYILASGIDDNYGAIYSRPKHIGIIRLP